jgi:hypothetical protein
MGAAARPLAVKRTSALRSTCDMLGYLVGVTMGSTATANQHATRVALVWLPGTRRPSFYSKQEQAMGGD